MNKTAIGLVTCLAITILISACQQDQYNSFNGNGDADDSTAPLAIVNDDTVTLKEYNRALNNHGWHRQENLDTMNFKKEVLYNHLVYRAARIKAEDYPLEMTEEIQERLDDHLNGILRKMLFENNVETRVEVSNEEVQEYYNSNQGRFYRPVEAEVAHIFFDLEKTKVPNSDNMDSIALEKLRDSLTLERANEVYARLQGGQSFEKMARAFSDDKASAEQGGYFRSLNQGQLEPSLDTVIFSSIGVGRASEPIKTGYGYHIIKVLERSGDDYAPLDDNLREFIHNELLSTKTRAEAARYFDSLVAVSDIQYNMDFIQGNIDMSDSDWTIIMHEKDTIYYPEYEKWRDRELKKDPRIQETMIFKREIIGQIASTWMLILEARKHGYHESEEYLQAKEDFLYQERLNTLMKQRQAKDYEPTDSLIAAYYEAHKDDFAEDRMISIQQVILESKTTADEVKAKLDSGANFYETALEYYPAEEEEIKKMAINLGWISKDDISPDFFNKIYELETGEISEPIKTEWGYHIVKVLGKKGVKPLESVRVEIRKKLLQDYKDSVEARWSERMLEGVEIKVDKDLFNEFIFHKEWLPKPDFSKMFPRY